MLLLLIACATEPAPPPAPISDPVVAELQRALETRGEPRSWLQPSRSAPPGAGAPAPSTAPPLDARGQADALFNRAMTANETGDTTAAAQLLPLALQAYAVVPGLDLDGHFHVGVLQLAAGRATDAQATADFVLVKRPTHLLALGLAARAAVAASDRNAARGYWQRYVDAHDAEQGQLGEYLDHEVLLPIYLHEATAGLGG